MSPEKIEPRVSQEEVERLCMDDIGRDPDAGRGSIIPNLARDVRDARAERNDLFGLMQRFQPAGSPPPLPMRDFAFWILQSMNERAERAEARALAWGEVAVMYGALWEKTLPPDRERPAVCAELDAIRASLAAAPPAVAPDPYEYRTTSGQRKAWDGEPDLSKEGWEEVGEWERFDYHEERQWRRLRAAPAGSEPGPETK